MLLAGRYEGFDHRVHDHVATEALSLGPFVLSGGEVAAMAVIDAVARFLEGSLGDAASSEEESFSPALDGLRRVPALHAAAELPRLGRARGAALGRPRTDRRVASRAGRGAHPQAAR